MKATNLKTSIGYNQAGVFDIAITISTLNWTK